MDHYELLDIPRTATAEQVRDAYLRLSKRVHPDSGGSAALFRQVEEAYRVLSNPTERQRYDRDRSRSTGDPSSARTNQVLSPQDLAEAVIQGATKLAKEVAREVAREVIGKRTQRKHDDLVRRQAIWPKTLGLGFLRVELQAWEPFLAAAVAGQTRCRASWAREEVIDPPMRLLLLRCDAGSPPHQLIWQVEGGETEWVSWRAANADGSEIELMMRFDSSAGARPTWARRRFPTGTHLIVDDWQP